MKVSEGKIEKKNQLPREGEVYYYGKLIAAAEADEYLRYLLNDIEWKNDEAIIFGRHLFTKRKVAWYGDSEFPYTYSNVTRKALPWTTELLRLKIIAEDHTGESFNSCLLNLYHNGAEGMGWHRDEERELKQNGAIASMSFGAERKFLFRHRQSRETITMVLEHGSLLVMKGTTQSHWLHRLPPAMRIKSPRVNLTFRTIRI